MGVKGSGNGRELAMYVLQQLCIQFWMAAFCLPVSDLRSI